jgi:hypothetical protein
MIGLNGISSPTHLSMKQLSGIIRDFEVEGNCDQLIKKLCAKFFPICKIQHIRTQVINFKQGEEEGIDQAWNRFNELVEQGPRLRFPSDVLLHTFFFSPTPSCMQYVQMCAGGDLMEKRLTEAAQLLQKNKQSGGHAKRLGNTTFGEARM